MFFLFKQKPAYELRISDWSSDVCSSDLSCFLSATSWRALRLEYLGMARPPRRPEKAPWPPRRGGGGRRNATKRPGSGRRRTDRAKGTGAPRAVATGLRRPRRGSEESSVGKECVRTGRSRWGGCNGKKQK